MKDIYIIVNDEKKIGIREKLEFPFFDEKKFKRMNKQGFGIFKTVNPMIGVKRGEKYIQELKYLFCSYDLDKNIDKQVVAMNVLIDYCEPTKITITGTGIDVLWELEDSDPFNIEEYKKILKGAQEYANNLSGTYNMTNAASGLRVEGFEDRSTSEKIICSPIFKSEKKYSYKTLGDKFKEKNKFIPF